MSRPPAGLGAPVRPPAMPQRTAPVRPLHPERALPVPPPPRDDRRAIRAAVRARRRAEAAERRRPTALRHPRALAGGAVGVLVLLVGLPLLLAFGPVFPVRTIAVTGVSGGLADTVRSALRGQLGRPVALVEDRDVAAALARVPAVERFALVRRPPGTLEVAVVPRVAVVQQRTAAGWARLDAAHVTVSVEPDPSGALPVLTVPAGTPAGAYASVVAALDALRRSDPPVTAVRLASADDVELTLRGGLLVRWGGPEHGAAKAEALDAALRRAAKGATEVDVSSPGVVLTR
ncbi:cell division protein FtsQ/DivIB [Amnibacterium kyonggiense]|uniref:Cell division protein FtsQ n=1 Tax=Amnibacterium kyonggiense TaxID=595671 RepID=A0A4R7FKY0_9MICO|nr:FtsQ-type POTRA domain-containing protein [Amnibacterium kyonggiense]TDS77026.1 cell division protein FtsQ [Amnibacterium kyonggiense]